MTHPQPPAGGTPDWRPAAAPGYGACAQTCFAGDMQACDDLFHESPPLSAYEQYAWTCERRVTSYTVPYCTDLGG